MTAHHGLIIALLSLSSSSWSSSSSPLLPPSPPHQHQHIVLSLHRCFVIAIIIPSLITPSYWVLALCQTLCSGLYMNYLTSSTKLTVICDYPHFTDDRPEAQRHEVICSRSQNSHQYQHSLLHKIKIHPTGTRGFSLFLGIKKIARLSFYGLLTEGCCEFSKKDLRLLFSNDSCSLIQKNSSSFD